MDLEVPRSIRGGGTIQISETIALLSREQDIMVSPLFPGLHRVATACNMLPGRNTEAAARRACQRMSTPKAEPLGVPSHALGVAPHVVPALVLVTAAVTNVTAK